jgi:hypothetical protein
VPGHPVEDAPVSDENRAYHATKDAAPRRGEFFVLLPEYSQLFTDEKRAEAGTGGSMRQGARP